MKSSLVFVLLIVLELIVLIKSEDGGQISGSSNDIIYITDKSMQTVRLKSVLGVLNQTTTASSSQKLFWSFKRIYFIPNLQQASSESLSSRRRSSSFYVKSSFELAQNELMISLDSEVQDNLKEKYSIGGSGGGEDETSIGNNDDESRFDLVINNLTYADSGLYKCNLWNQKTIYYRLTVTSSISKPEINIEYASPKKNSLIPDNMFMESSSLVIKCTSRHSYPYPTIKWFRNNVELLPTENRINYKLVDKETNTIESTLSLKNLTHSLNMNNITCKLVQIQQQQQQPVDTATTIATSSSSDSLMSSEQQLWQTSDPILLNIAFKPVLSIDVIKTNETTAALSDLVSYQTISLNSTNNKIYLYESDAGVLFHCKHKSNPSDQISLVWSINGVAQNQSEFSDHDVFVWDKRATKKLNSREVVKLTCEVENRIGISSFTIDIIVLYEPKIRLDRSHYEVDEFSQVQLNCLVDASPLAVLTEWRVQNSSSHQLSSLPIANSTVLEFKSIRHTENAGAYVCHSENVMNDSFGDVRRGLAEFTVEIEVRFKPQMNTVYKKLAAATSLDEDSASSSLEDNLTNNSNNSSAIVVLSQNISCMTMANPAPVFNWFKNGMKIPLSSVKYSIDRVRSKSKNLYESVLVIHDLNERDDLNQKYVCEASNALGSSQIEYELVAKSRPDEPSEIRTLRVDFMTISLAWSAGFDGGSSQTFLLKVNETLVDLNTTTNSSVITVHDKMMNTQFRVIKQSQSLINITNLMHDTAYSLSLSAKNRLGRSGWSEPILVKTRTIDQSQVASLAELETMFLNVPKNRLEFEFKSIDNYSSSSVTSFIPICLNISVQLYRPPNQQNKSKFKFVKCLSLNETLNGQRQVVQFDSMPQEDTIMIGDEESTTSQLDREKFNAKQVKWMRVAVCFRMNSSVCAKPISAIIDTYNKLSHYKKKTGEKNGNIEDYFNNDSDEYSAENGFLDKLGLSSKLKSLMSPHSISTTLIVSIGVCIATLIVILFAMIICCMRKHNFKMCKHVMSQANTAADTCCGGGKQNTNYLSTSSGSGSTSPDSNNKFTKEIIAVSKPSDAGRSTTTTGVQSIANKAFDTGYMISAPMTNHPSYNTNTMLSLNGGGVVSSQYGNSLNQELCGTGIGGGNTLPKQHQIGKKRTFTAALTATATNIISNSIGKHKINEILVTEDDEQSRYYKNITQSAAAASHHHQFGVGHSEFICGEIDETDMHKLTDSPPPMLTIHNNNNNNLSQHTPSTAVSNCSSSSNNNMAATTPASIYNHTNMMIMNHDDKNHHHHHQTVGLTLIEGYNSSGGSTTSSGSCSANSASNSDPVAINNSLSSTNSATESPTYGYNVTSGATLNLQQQQQHNVPSYHHHHHDPNQIDNFFYIKANLSANQETTNMMEEGESYVKTTSGLGSNGIDVHTRGNIRNSMRSSHNPNTSCNNTNTSSCLSTSMANHTINGGGYMMSDPPESGYSTPSRHKKVVYEVIV